jgi:hypothetical protein
MKSVYILPIALLCTLPALSFADTMDMKGINMSGSRMNQLRIYTGLRSLWALA